MHLPTFLTIVLMALVALHQTTTDTRVAGHHWGRRGTEQISEGATTGNTPGARAASTNQFTKRQGMPKAGGAGGGGGMPKPPGGGGGGGGMKPPGGGAGGPGGAGGGAPKMPKMPGGGGAGGE